MQVLCILTLARGWRLQRCPLLTQRWQDLRDPSSSEQQQRLSAMGRPPSHLQPHPGSICTRKAGTPSCTPACCRVSANLLAGAQGEREALMAEEELQS